MTPFETLEIPVTATKEEIKKAYLEACKKHHPDRGGDKEKFKQIQDAYNSIGGEITGEWEKLISSMIEKAFNTEDVFIADYILERLNQDLESHKNMLKSVKHELQYKETLEKSVLAIYNYDPLLVKSLMSVINKLRKEVEHLEEVVKVNHKAIEYFMELKLPRKLGDNNDKSCMEKS